MAVALNASARTNSTYSSSTRRCSSPRILPLHHCNNEHIRPRSSEVETIFYAHPGQYVREVVVAGVSVGTNAHERLLRAWLVLSKAGEKAGDPAVVDALRRWTERHLVKSKWLHGGIEVVGELPKSSTGKTLRRVLVDDYERRVGVMVKGKL